MDIAKLQSTLTAARFGTEFDAATSRVPRRERSHYLGMSSIGKCQAELWRHYHRKEAPRSEIEPRVLRIFSLGDAIEDMCVEIIGHMEGVKVLSTQAEYSDFDGEFRGHSDLVLEIAHQKVVADIKSMNANQFRRFEDMGLRRSHPEYYAQLTMYAGHENADSVMLVAMNKDTCAIHVEALPFSEGDFTWYRAKAKRVLESKTMPSCEKQRWCSCKS